MMKFNCLPKWIDRRAFGLLFALTPMLANADVQIPKDWPRMQPGYMETKMNMGGHTQTMHMCMTKEDMDGAEDQVAKDNNCTLQSATRKGNQFFVEMDCKDPETNQPMHMKLQSTLISSTQMKAKMVTTQNGQTKMTMTNEMKRLRACSDEEKEQSGRMRAGTPTAEDVMGQVKDVLGEGGAEKLKDMMKMFE